MSDEAKFAIAFLVVGGIAGCLVGLEVGGLNMCSKWAGELTTVYEGKCMVREKDGALRPARKDGER